MLEFLPLTIIVFNHHNTYLKRRLRTCSFLLSEWINHYYSGVADLRKKKNEIKITQSSKSDIYKNVFCPSLLKFKQGSIHSTVLSATVAGTDCYFGSMPPRKTSSD